ncbi:heat shock factor-binding protein-like [Hibiscus syriacus]|uniref:heat shock factor-binding protein-like n=1 Tax=Hibiscus syriacus TaxID=106335 RepID=UPI00192503A0|nr:heat shock factor-binding protein-like [Hibiscus syriacus]
MVEGKMGRKLLVGLMGRELRVMVEVEVEVEHTFSQDGRNSDELKPNIADMSIFVQDLLQQMQTRFQTMSDSIIAKIDEMGDRRNKLENSINDLKAEMGVDGSPSPLAPSKQK